jgi:probable HAF family extracellular repeat protein
MKSTTLMYMVGMTLFAALAAQMAAQDQPEQNKNQLHYSVTNLGTLGGTQSYPNGINNGSWVTGAADLPGGQNEHAFLWIKGQMTDLGTLGGPNSLAWPVNDRGEVAGDSETSSADPFKENFCHFNIDGVLEVSDRTCRGFVWQDGVVTMLPTLGGNNSQVFGINRRGQVVGTAENSTQNPNCIPPQVLDSEAVIWGPKKVEIQELPPLPGDSDAAAVAINDRGQAAGGSSPICGPLSPAGSAHAVLWQDGVVTDLGSFGGVMSNVALAINNRGQVVGASDLPGDTTSHAFLSENGAMTDLGTLPGDFLSVAWGINDEGQVVGESCDVNGNCRAFLWQDKVMTDLNTLVDPGSSLYLIVAQTINSRGEIVGEAFDQSTGDVPAFLAIPSDHGNDCKVSSSAEQKIILPENVREKLLQRRGLGRFAAGLTRPQ